MKKLLAVVVAVITMFSIIGCGSAGGKDSKSAMSSEQAEKNSLKIIQKALECNDETAKKHYDVLKSAGLTPIEEIFFTNDIFDWNMREKNYRPDTLLGVFIVKGGGESVRMVVYETKNTQIISNIVRGNGGTFYSVGDLKLNPSTGVVEVSNPTGKLKNYEEISTEQADKYIEVAQNAVRDAFKGRLIKFRLYPNGMYNGKYSLKKSKLAKDVNAPYIVNGSCYMTDERGQFISPFYTVYMDKTYKVKNIKVTRDTGKAAEILLEARY